MTPPGDELTFTVKADGMCIDYQVPVPMSDGAVLRADVFRPCEDGDYPVILSHGVYAKGLPFNGPIYQMQWDKLLAKDPSVLEDPRASTRLGRSPTRSVGSPTATSW